MATVQGICKNCGSLVFLNDQDSLCECLFCNCVFPSSEAIALLEHPEDHDYPNEKFEKSTSTTHHYVTPTLPDQVASAVERDKKAQVLSPTEREKNEYELSPDDVKAPKKLVLWLAAGTLVLVGIIVAISVPLYFSRTKVQAGMNDRISGVVDGIISVDTSVDEETGDSVGFVINGLNCQRVKFVTPDKVTEAQAVQIFENYANARAEVKEADVKMNDISMQIYCDGGIMEVSYDGSINAVFAEDAEPVVTEAETEAPTES